jgi:hypothetical protein
MFLEETVETTTAENSTPETTEVAEISLEEEIEAMAKGEEASNDTPVEASEEAPQKEAEEITAEEGSEQEPNEEEQFTPDFTYKAYGQIKEMPEWAQSLVNKDNHDEVKSLFEKAGGFEHLKEYSKGIEGEYKNLQQNYTELDQVRNEVVNAIQTKNLDKAFEALNLDENTLFEWVSKTTMRCLKSRDKPLMLNNRQLSKMKYFNIS